MMKHCERCNKIFTSSPDSRCGRNESLRIRMRAVATPGSAMQPRENPCIGPTADLHTCMSEQTVSCSFSQRVSYQRD
jgi:hypothetical protein